MLSILLAAALAVDVDKLLARMTHEEKIGQLIQYNADNDAFPAALASGKVGSILFHGDIAKTNEFQRKAMEGSRQKIPLLIGFDVIHGYRTIFPVPIAIASSWEPGLAEMSAQIAAREARAMGIHWTFAPMVDVARDPRWGRIMEGAGEDPLLGSRFAAAYVRGYQSGGLLACAKHFAAYGDAEGGRDYGTADVSESTLREVYLPPFKAAVDAGVASFMSAFDSLNGVPATANARLLDEILRREWKFRGFVVSDWTAVAELMNHGIAATPKEAATKALRAGVDLDMVDAFYLQLPPSDRVDRAARRILEAKKKAGLFAEPFTKESTIVLDRDAARRVARKSIVLLKNDGVLPFARSKKIAIVGALADSKKDMLGEWKGQGQDEDVVTVREAIRSVPVAGADVLVAGHGETREMSGEAASRATFDLPDEKSLEPLLATGKPVVLVICAGRPLAIPWSAAHVNAIVYAWFPGIEAGNAIADVLFGDMNPSAKLPVTFPRTTGQVPIYYAHLPSGRPADPKNKYSNKYIDAEIGPLYPFGYGLSYTTFEYSNISVDGLSVSADVRNTGSRAGEEIVQFYVNDPVASVSRPVKELKDFRKVALPPGETTRVTFTLSRNQLRYWTAKGWVFEPGRFNVWIGPDSERGLASSLVISR
jgi:beta-glucosidase